MFEEGESIGKVFWQGIVRIDKTFDNYASNVSEQRDHKLITVADHKYAHEGLGYGEWYYNDPERSIVDGTRPPFYIWIKDREIHEFMKCFAVYTVTMRERTKGLIRKQIYHEPIFKSKGYVLEPTSLAPKDHLPCLASYRASIGQDNNFTIHQKGLNTFLSGSRSAETSDAARKSLTAVFIASDQNPFTATVREKGRVFNIRFGSQGFADKAIQDIGRDSKSTRRGTDANDPLTVLKLRLARGEIAKEEYEELRKMLEN